MGSRSGVPFSLGLKVLSHFPRKVTTMTLIFLALRTKKKSDSSLRRHELSCRIGKGQCRKEYRKSSATLKEWLAEMGSHCGSPSCSLVLDFSGEFCLRSTLLKGRGVHVGLWKWWAWRTFHLPRGSHPPEAIANQSLPLPCC